MRNRTKGIILFIAVIQVLIIAGLLALPAVVQAIPGRNRFVRWSRAGIFNKIFHELSRQPETTEGLMIDATHLKAHRTDLARPASSEPQPDAVRDGCGGRSRLRRRVRRR